MVARNSSVQVSAMSTVAVIKKKRSGNIVPLPPAIHHRICVSDLSQGGVKMRYGFCGGWNLLPLGPLAGRRSAVNHNVLVDLHIGHGLILVLQTALEAPLATPKQRKLVEVGPAVSQLTP